MPADRVAWITGATGGLGPAVVKALDGDGAIICATAQRTSELEALRAELGVKPAQWLGQAADLTDAGAASANAAQILVRFGRIDILVAIAGGWRGGQTVAETELATLDWLLKINLVTAFNASRAALPAMMAGGWGRIVTIGARSSIVGQAKSGSYAASKAALLALTQSIAAETRGTGITANTVLISTIDTPANRASMPAADFGRWVQPEQIAATIRFLCSDEAASISGSAIPIYGSA